MAIKDPLKTTLLEGGGSTKKTDSGRQTYTYTPFQYQDYTKSDEVITAETNKAKAEQALANYGDFTYSNADLFKETMNKILNREKFSYDLNGDALYQQYKDKYIQQGKLAMADTMGQAAAMTGGFGNSYAATVGNQAYQASLQQLNDIVPELYQLAYDRYNQEEQSLYNQYGMLSNDRSMEYGMWGDKRNALVTDRDYYGTEANNAFNRDYGIYSDDRNLAYGEHTTTEGYKYQDVADANAYDQWKTEYDEGVRQYNEQVAYQKSRDAVADSQWNQSFALQKQQANKSTTPSTPTLTAKEYNEILQNAETYAANGQTALKNYLNGLVSRGLSKDEAADIYEQYFPLLTKKNTSPGRNNFEVTLN